MRCRVLMSQKVHPCKIQHRMLPKTTGGFTSGLVAVMTGSMGTYESLLS